MIPPQDLATFIKTYCIALTGGIASGKTTIAAILKQRGFLVFDADQCARNVVAPGSEGLFQLRDAFGVAMIQPDGTLNRDHYRHLIATDPNARKKSDTIMHPLIRLDFIKQISATDLLKHPQYFFYEAALIHETGRGSEFKSIWCAFCPPSIQLDRLLRRSPGKLSLAEATALIAAQMPVSEKAKKSDVIIDTSNSFDEVAAQIDRQLAMNNLQINLSK